MNARIVAAAAIITAVLVAPVAVQPGFNGADLLEVLASSALIALGLRSLKTPVGDERPQRDDAGAPSPRLSPTGDIDEAADHA